MRCYLMVLQEVFRLRMCGLEAWSEAARLPHAVPW